MTRARKTLTLCEAIGGQHPFVRELIGLVMRSRPTALPPEAGATPGPGAPTQA